MQSPFSFGRAVVETFFTNREQEVRKLALNFQHGINTIIISPRRWGKSSLVEKVAGQVKSRNIKVAKIDMFGLRTEEEFYNALANAVIKANSSKLEEWLALGKKFLKSITPKFTVELGDKQRFSLELDQDAVRKHYREFLELPEKMAKEKKAKMVVCIDEFQNITAFQDPQAFQKKLRSVWQHQQNVTYCLYGSKQHMMTELFNRQSNAFYRFGEIMMLDKITEEKWKLYITRQFTGSGKKIGEKQAVKIIRSVECHPYYVQQLSHIVWTNSPSTVTDAVVEQGINELLDQNALLYYRESESLNNTELKLLRAIADKVEQYTSVGTLKKYRLGTSAGVVKARRSLVAKELIDLEKGRLVFLDPCFRLWFIKHLLAEDY